MLVLVVVLQADTVFGGGVGQTLLHAGQRRWLAKPFNHDGVFTLRRTGAEVLGKLRVEVTVVAIVAVKVSVSVSVIVLVLVSAVKVVIAVVETVDVCVTVLSVGAFPVAVRVTVVGLGAIVVVVKTVFVEVLRFVFVTGWGKYPGQKPLQKPLPLWFLNSFVRASWLSKRTIRKDRFWVELRLQTGFVRFSSVFLPSSLISSTITLCALGSIYAISTGPFPFNSG